MSATGDFPGETGEVNQKVQASEIPEDPRGSSVPIEPSAAIGAPTRRELLKQASVVGMAATLPFPILAGKGSRLSAAVPAADSTATLTAAESETLKAMVARIIPADENGPGALEARADHYIDLALGGALASMRPLYAAGLAAVDAYAQSSKGALFAKLTPAGQDAVLAEMQENRATGFPGRSSEFFDTVRTHTIQGTFADPFYGGNANFIGWDLIGYPGARVVVTAEEQLAEAKPNHKSAYDYGMFTKGVL